VEIRLGYVQALGIIGFADGPYLGYFPSGAPAIPGPVIDFSIDSNSMYAAIVSAFV
jgi:hypothetical protein